MTISRRNLLKNAAISALAIPALGFRAAPDIKEIVKKRRFGTDEIKIKQLREEIERLKKSNIRLQEICLEDDPNYNITVEWDLVLLLNHIPRYDRHTDFIYDFIYTHKMSLVASDLADQCCIILREGKLGNSYKKSYYFDLIDRTLGKRDILLDQTMIKNPVTIQELEDMNDHIRHYGL